MKAVCTSRGCAADATGAADRLWFMPAMAPEIAQRGCAGQLKGRDRCTAPLTGPACRDVQPAEAQDAAAGSAPAERRW